MIRGRVSCPLLPATQEMLAWTLTDTPSPSPVEEAKCILSSDLGEEDQAGWLEGLWGLSLLSLSLRP